MQAGSEGKSLKKLEALTTITGRGYKIKISLEVESSDPEIEKATTLAAKAFVDILTDSLGEAGVVRLELLRDKLYHS